MDFKDKIEICLMVFEELQDCMRFNFGALDSTLNEDAVKEKIQNYKNMLEKL